MTREALRLLREIFILAAVILLGAAGLSALQRLSLQKTFESEYDQIIRREAEKNNLPPSLVYAVIKNESGFDPAATSSIGARGLMQLTEETFDWVKYRMKDKDSVLGYDSMYDGETNIIFGTYLLKLLLEEFSETEVALAAYHAGWGSVKRWLADGESSSDGRNLHYIPYSDTRAYVKKVIETMEYYEKIHK